MHHVYLRPDYSHEVLSHSPIKKAEQHCEVLKSQTVDAQSVRDVTSSAVTHPAMPARKSECACSFRRTLVHPSEC